MPQVTLSAWQSFIFVSVFVAIAAAELVEDFYVVALFFNVTNVGMARK